MLTRYRGIAAFVFGCWMISMLAPMTPAQQPTPLKKDFDTSGEYVGMAGRYAMKCILDGNPTVVRFDQKSTVKVTGTASADFLDKGIYVKFKGTLDRQHKGTDPIKDFTIFTPDANNPLGAVISTGGGNAFDEQNATVKKKGPPPPTADYDIAGRISTAHNNQLSIDCGNMKVRVEVAPDATVKLDATDPSWATQGDSVKVKGTVDQPPHGVALAIDVSVILTNPLAPRKKAHIAKTADKVTDKASKATSKTAKGDADADNADKKGADPKADDSKAADKGADAKAADKGADKGTEAKTPDDKNDAKKPDDKADAGK